jgi:ribonuclease HI
LALSTDKSEEISIYSDGACLGNPGPGGYGAIVITNGGRHELSGGYQLTTNNRMEIMGAIVALESLGDKCRVTLYTDSKYVVDAMSLGWVQKWRAKGWRRGGKAPALNPDLWQRMLDICARHEVTFRWVKGHHTSVDNNRCDALANGTAHQPNLPVDSGYHPNPQKKLF